MRHLRRPTRLAALVALPLALAACSTDPGRQVAVRRAAYDATLQSYVVRDDPATGGRTFILDVLVGWQGGEPLPGLTLDVSMAAPGGAEKAHRRVWIETAGVDRGGEQITLELADLPWEPGDGFFVEVRSPVPAAERGDYREFAAGG
jgi:hypothetical protein